jgi:hypothetical protein
MSDQNVHLLDARGIRQGNRQTNLRDLLCLPAVGASETNRTQSPSLRDLEGRQNVQ